MVMSTHKTSPGKQMQVVTEIGPPQDKEALATSGAEPITDAELIGNFQIGGNKQF